MGIIPEKLAVARTFAKELRGITLDDCTNFPFLVHGNVWHAGTIIERLCSEIEQLQRERDAAARTARWQFERRGKDGVTELPVCSGCGATPKYYAPKNDVGMQVPPYCHECGSKMAVVVKMEVE